MSKSEYIVVGDWSALHFFRHYDAAEFVEQNRVPFNPLHACARTASSLRAFDFTKSIYGEGPVSLLVSEAGLRRSGEGVSCAMCSADLPDGSFFRLRDGLYMTTPEFTFLRMATLVNVHQLAEMGMQLTALYYADCEAEDRPLPERARLLTTPERLLAYVQKCRGLRGAEKARNALRFVVENSKSPMENKAMLQYSIPMARGGFKLPFNAMNYKVLRKGYERMTTQDEYYVDIANAHRKIGLEYDGGESHQDASADIRRRNELKALGWEIFPLDKQVLYNPAATIRLAEQVAKYLGIRLRYPKSWDERFEKLRHDLNLPT